MAPDDDPIRIIVSSVHSNTRPDGEGLEVVVGSTTIPNRNKSVIILY